MQLIQPFTLAVPQSALDDLKLRLRGTCWPEDPDNDTWEYGSHLTFMKNLAEYWLNSFDWRRAEGRLNSIPQFTTEVDGLTIHFAHIRGSHTHAAPLVLTHGWPGCFAEMLAIAPLLTAPGDHGITAGTPFDLVIPSLPGFGFSQAPTHRGVNSRSIAATWHTLMTRLGYTRYFAQGGDIGAGVSTWLARLYPDALRGLHLNFIPGGYTPFTGNGAAPLSAAESRWLAQRGAWLDGEGAYAHLQGTKPQTLAYGLTDSPIALAAWIVEKFRAWSDCGGDVLSRFALDELLTNISIYWFSRNVGATLRIYKENRAAPLAFAAGERLTVPFAHAAFPREICPPPREWVERTFPIHSWTDMPRGGHFAAMEEPLLLARDIHAAFAGLR